MASNEATLLIRIKQAGQEILDRLVITAGDIADVFKKIPEFIGAAIEAFRESEAAVNRLTNSMMNQGTFTQSLRKEYLDLADSLSKVTTFQDDEIVSAQAILQTYSKNKKVTDELTRATLNLAAGKRIDLEQAATAVGKAISGETDTLLREKLALSENSKEGERYAAVLNKITGQHDNAATNAAKGLGSTIQLGNAWNDFLTNIGRLMGPFVSSLARGATAVLNFLNSFAGPPIEKMKLEEIDRAISKVKQNIIDAQMRGARLGLVDTTALDKELAALESAKAQILEMEQTAAVESNEIERQKLADRQVITDEAALIALENQIANVGLSGNALLMAELQQEIKRTDAKLAQAKTAGDKSLLLKQKQGLMEQQLQAKQDAQNIKDRDAFLNQVATMQTSHNRTMATIGKAAAIAQIWINTGQAAMSSFNYGSSMGGPYLGAAFAALAVAAGAAQAAKVAGVQLAEGGVVMPRPGGTQATIGEGGQAEAVIPLDKAGDMGFGGGTTIHFHGPIMGNEAQAEEFARAIDRQLLKLRRSNQSVAFETDVV